MKATTGPFTLHCSIEQNASPQSETNTTDRGKGQSRHAQEQRPYVVGPERTVLLRFQRIAPNKYEQTSSGRTMNHCVRLPVIHLRVFGDEHVAIVSASGRRQ
jgi:hypothetical protein